MIPSLDPRRSLQKCYLDFLQAVEASDYNGDIHTDYASRLACATDNSVYQVIPQAVLLPRATMDIVALLQLANQPRFHQISFTPRGGGTGTNGQSLTDGIILDLSRHMNQILEMDLEAGWVKVQPGVVLDQLNQELKPHGVFFAPDLSPSNRATLGGMANTDACGKGSRIYGRTSDHILALQTVLVDGSQWHSHPLDIQQLENLKQREDKVGHIHTTVDEICRGKRDTILERFPQLSRFLTGYNLKHVFNDDLSQFNLNYLLAGSEGTLAVVTELTLKLTPLPKCKALFAIQYASFDAALSSAQLLVNSDPAAIETIDDTIVQLAKGDSIWYQVGDLLGPQADKLAAINLVEFVTDKPNHLAQKIQYLSHTLDSATPEQGILGYYVTEQASEITSLWNLRKKGVGLLGNRKGDRRPIPFVEDTVVPPENLADYIREFRALLERHGLDYGMFGHVDVGCLHVRPALDMRNEDDERRFRQISDEVCDLVEKYGGIMWGEHSKGYRSEYGPRFYGDELYQDLRHIKAAFDPHNQLNPGKVCTPSCCDHHSLVSVDGPTRGQQDRQIPGHTREAFETSITCNGNGACFNYQADDVMCPSWKGSRDRLHSPKGRAGVMREWLRLLAENNSSPLQQRPGNLLQRTLNSLRQQEDFSHQVTEAMSGCLGCKACATQCPIKVNVPNLKSRFLHNYYGRYLRPPRDYMVAAIEGLSYSLARIPKLINRLSNLPGVHSLLRRILGFVDPPQLSEYTLRQGLRQRQATYANTTSLSQLSDVERERSVVLVQDAFTSHYEADVVLACYDLLTQLGIKVYVQPFQRNGKALHVKGMLDQFQRVAQRQAQQLQAFSDLGMSLVGVDPSMTLVYRDEYPELDIQVPQVQLLQEWLTSHLEQLNLPERLTNNSQYRLWGHCTEKALAQTSQQQWQQVFSALGLELQLDAVGCCGMSGSYGHEQEHLAASQGIFELSWGKKLKQSTEPTVLATGFSCRSQARRFADRQLQHPAQALVAALAAKA